MIESLKKIKDKYSNISSELRKELITLDEINATLNFVQSVKQEYIVNLLDNTVKTVSEILKVVFPDYDYKFNLKLDLSGKKPKIIPTISEGGAEYGIAALSGGLLELISLLVRISLVLLNKRKLLILDEPFKFLDKGRKRILLRILLDLDFQVIFVTHDHDLVNEFKNEIQIVTL